MHHRLLSCRPLALALAGILLAAAPSAQADMVLSKVIVDLKPTQRATDDIEIWNDGTDRLYIVVEPSVILAPGLAEQQRVPAADPSVSGLLVSPQRIILEPGERRQVRVSAIMPRGSQDRVYRVTIKPVAGPVTASTDALKVYVGYDVLVLQRAAVVSGEVMGARHDKMLTLRNDSSTAWEVFEGRQCASGATRCRPLPATRLYSGAEFDVALPNDGPVEYKVTDGTTTRKLTF